ncbi:hypothetical protein BD311DRAFT_777869 [Dichomitus squalens]|uniref:Uncharacterized protein n=1 Tax=Dichomitus squalens TaxID=114155 RepID=A0A4V2K0H9_9APHY|nr:hypothetical protein BD311DRAFT_777869 [Dichomitus squalens]
MAPTLSDTKLTSILNSVPPPSQEFVMQQVPDVFVHPPEEEHEHNPPWCYFDATQAAKDSLDMEALDVALSFCQQTDNRAPAFRRAFSNESQETVVMPRRSMKNLKLRAADLEMEMELEPDGLADIRSRGIRRYDDIDVVEVVKFRRDEGGADVGQERSVKTKKTSTFRARATQALRSIKNVGKGNRDRRATVSAPQRSSQDQHLPRSQDQNRNDVQAATLQSPRSTQEPSSSRPTSPSLSRRKSLNIAQLFTSFKDKENQTSRPTSPADEMMSPTSLTLVDSDSPPSARPLSPAESTLSRTRTPSPFLEDFLPSEGAQAPKIEKRRSFVRRLSVLELQKLFGSGNSNPTSAPSQSAAPAGLDDVFTSSRSHPESIDSVAILSASSSRTSTASSGAMFSRPSSSSQVTQQTTVEADSDLEMRLDSLHFDSLHFDPEEVMSLL